MASDRDTGKCPTCGHALGRPGGPTPPTNRCIWCPPQTCERCGQLDSHDKPCPCWISLAGMAMADIKALFARDGGFQLDHRQEATPDGE